MLELFQARGGAKSGSVLTVRDLVQNKEMISL